MDPQLIAIIVNNIALPEILKAIGRLMGRGEQVTEESVRAELNFNADTAISNGTAWLQANPPTV